MKKIILAAVLLLAGCQSKPVYNECTIYKNGDLRAVTEVPTATTVNMDNYVVWSPRLGTVAIPIKGTTIVRGNCGW